MPTFTIDFVSPAIKDHPLEQFREEREEQTDLTVECLHGCFNSTLRIMAYEGEVQIFIHTTQGHYFNWTVVICRADTAPLVIPGPEYQKGSTIQDAFDTIAEKGECGAWWGVALPKIKESVGIS